jgi:hypothetical protein
VHPFDVKLESIEPGPGTTWAWRRPRGSEEKREVSGDISGHPRQRHRQVASAARGPFFGSPIAAAFFGEPAGSASLIGPLSSPDVIHVIPSDKVSPDAATFTMQNDGWSFAAKDIQPATDRFQMNRITAGVISAEMVDGHPIGNVTFDQLKCDAVCVLHAPPTIVVDKELSVSVLRSGLPFPARIVAT